MKILLTGATGFIGQKLTKILVTEGHSITILSRSKTNAQKKLFKLLANNTNIPIDIIEDLSELDKTTEINAVINLAGENIANKYWTAEQKHKIWRSRVELTLEVVNWIKESQNSPRVLISASAVGYYGHQGNNDVHEDTRATPGFNHELCRHWEQAAHSATRYDCRVFCMRLGIVLDQDGGFIKKLRPINKAGLGIIFGSGDQWQPWIHRDDVIQIILNALTNESYFSTVNAVAPETSQHKQLSKAIGRRIGHQLWLPIPSWILNLVMPDMAHLFLDSVKATPTRLLEFDFQFQYPTLEKALDRIFNATESSNTD